MGQKQDDHVLRELTSCRKILKTHPWVAEELLRSVLWNLDIAGGFGLCIVPWLVLGLSPGWVIGPQCSTEIPGVGMWHSVLASRCSTLSYACLLLAGSARFYLLGSVTFHFRINLETPSILLWPRLRCLSKMSEMCGKVKHRISGVSHGESCGPLPLSPDGKKSRRQGAGVHRLKRQEKGLGH